MVARNANLKVRWPNYKEYPSGYAIVTINVHIRRTVERLFYINKRNLI